MKASIVLFAVVVSLLTGCGSVFANGPFTLIDKPTQITSDQEGDFMVKAGSLYGPPSATGQGVKVHGNITVTGPALLQDLLVNGCIVVDRAARVEITRVWVQNCPGDGITFQSDAGGMPQGNQSCCAKLDHVVSLSNGGSGLKLINTADIFVIMSEFENNHGYGMEMFGSPTARIANSDFGGNGLGGILADRDSGKNLLSNIQFGNNRGDDISLDSSDNDLNSLGFIGPPGFCSIRSIGPQVIGANSYGPRSRCVLTP